MKLQQSFLLVGIFSISALNSGCNDKQDTKVYSVAKETPAAPQSPQIAAPPGGVMPVTPAGHPSVGGMTDVQIPSGKASAPEIDTGTPPPQWKMKAPSSMRVASFEVSGEKEATADISLILLNGAAGGVLANVNRWQSQLGQPDLTEETLAQKAQVIDSPLGKVTVVDLLGLPAGADAAKDGRIVAGIASTDSMTFFFKMRGNAELVEAQKEDFVKWVSKVRVAAGKPAAEASPSPDNAAAPAPVPPSK